MSERNPIDPDAVRAHYLGNIERLQAKMARNDRINDIVNNVFWIIMFFFVVIIILGSVASK